MGFQRAIMVYDYVPERDLSAVPEPLRGRFTMYTVTRCRFELVLAHDNDRFIVSASRQLYNVYSDRHCLYL